MHTTEYLARSAPARRPRGLVRLCWAETLLFLREPAAMFFSLVFPMAMLFFLGLAYGGTDEDGVRFIDRYVPQVVVVVAMNIGLLGVAINIAECRSRGILRRYKLAPVPFWWFWLSQVYVVVPLLSTLVNVFPLLS